MLATPGEMIPVGDDWVHEVKWDGMRVMADVSSGGLRLTSRTERDITVAFPELAPLADQFADMHLDGEVVVMSNGIPSFAALSERIHVTDARRAAQLAATLPARYFIFDLVRLYGVDLTGRSFSDRRKTLERLDLQSPSWQIPPIYDDGLALHAATLEQGLEGIVSKLRSSPYLPGQRSPAWLKKAHRQRSSVVIGGWRPETTSSGRLGAILVGIPGPGGLHFLGRVGSGLAGAAAQRLLADLAPLTADESPFADEVPALDAQGTT